MYHTSPDLILEGTINGHGVAGDCLFFSDDVYVMTASDEYHVYSADFDCVRAFELYDDEIIDEISDHFGCDTDLAERLLDGRLGAFDVYSEEDIYDSGLDMASLAWWLQGKRGECAVKMGHDGCQDEDEQGTVYIVPMFGRESELTLIGTQTQKKSA
jgi:hypothetical protein